MHLYMLEVGITYNPRRHDQCVSFFLFLGLLSSPLLEKKKCFNNFFLLFKNIYFKNYKLFFFKKTKIL